MSFFSDLSSSVGKAVVNTAAGSSNPYLKTAGGLLGGGGGSGAVVNAGPPPPAPHKSAPSAVVGKPGKGFGKAAIIAIAASGVALFIALRK